MWRDRESPSEPRSIPEHSCASRPTASFLPCQRTTGDAVPLTQPHKVSTHGTTPLDGTEPSAILYGAWTWGCARFTVSPISCPIPSGCCRDGSTQQPPESHAVNTEAWEYSQPQNRYCGACWRPQALQSACPLPLLPITVASGHIVPIFTSHPAFATLHPSHPHATHDWAGG